MDDLKVGGAGNPNLPVPLPADIKLLEGPRKNEEKPEVKTINHETHPELRVAFENSFLPVQTLRNFITWQKNKLSSSTETNFHEAFRYDSLIANTIQDLIPGFAKNGIDLIETLKTLLITSNDFNEKTILLKALFSLDFKDEIACLFIEPVLQKKKDFPNLDQNYMFFIEFLRALDKDDREILFNTICYEKIENIKDFAASLLQIAPPDIMLEIFVKLDSQYEGRIDGDYDIEKRRIKIQKIALEVISQMEDNLYDDSLIGLEKLYRNAVSSEVTKDAANLLTKHFQRDSVRIFRELMLDRSDTTDKQRLKRFYAISHYAQAICENAAQTLRTFILEEEDPFLVGVACYELVNRCEIDGKRALTDVISKQIKEKTPSIPLAVVTQLAGYGEQYLTILKNVFNKDFSGKGNLHQAYTYLSGVELCLIEKNDEGTLVFQMKIDYVQDLVFDMISKIGLVRFCKYAAFAEGKTSDYSENFRRNICDVLLTACKLSQEKMKKLILESYVVAGEEDISLFKKLSGLSNFGVDSYDSIEKIA